MIKKEENENKEIEEGFDLWPDINKAYVKDDDNNENDILIDDYDHNEVIDLHI